MIQTSDPSMVPDSVAASPIVKSHVLVVALIGPPGSGKTALIEATAQQLHGKLRLGVIVVNPAARRDAKRISRYCNNVQAVNTALPDSSAISPALANLPLDQIDLLIIESMGGIAGPLSFPQDHTVCVLSVSGGDDKAAEYSKLLAASSAIVLSKAELKRHVMFNSDTFRVDLERINPKAELMEVSAFNNTGMDRWLAWLENRREEKYPSHPISHDTQPEWFLG